jgi:hypothetical protein
MARPKIPKSSSFPDQSAVARVLRAWVSSMIYSQSRPRNRYPSKLIRHMGEMPLPGTALFSIMIGVCFSTASCGGDDQSAGAAGRGTPSTSGGAEATGSRSSTGGIQVGNGGATQTSSNTLSTGAQNLGGSRSSGGAINSGGIQNLAGATSSGGTSSGGMVGTSGATSCSSQSCPEGQVCEDLAWIPNYGNRTDTYSCKVNPCGTAPLDCGCAGSICNGFQCGISGGYVTCTYMAVCAAPDTPIATPSAH